MKFLFGLLLCLAVLLNAQSPYNFEEPWAFVPATDQTPCNGPTHKHAYQIYAHFFGNRVRGNDFDFTFWLKNNPSDVNRIGVYLKWHDPMLRWPLSGNGRFTYAYKCTDQGTCDTIAGDLWYKGSSETNVSCVSDSGAYKCQFRIQNVKARSSGNGSSTACWGDVDTAYAPSNSYFRMNIMFYRSSSTAGCCDPNGLNKNPCNYASCTSACSVACDAEVCLEDTGDYGPDYTVRHDTYEQNGYNGGMSKSYSYITNPSRRSKEREYNGFFNSAEEAVAREEMEDHGYDPHHEERLRGVKGLPPPIDLHRGWSCQDCENADFGGAWK